MKFPVIISLAILAPALFSCSAQPEPFKYGKDLCHTCKMSIIDPKFGCQLITNKGKIFKFDDVICMSLFIKSGSVEERDVKQQVVINFEKENDFLDVNKTFFVVAPGIKSPMGSHAAAFVDKETAEKFNTGKTGTILTWKELLLKLD
ncbi:MAG TPA: nitrous oxide reductase accessory protein NosL [Chitinophagaceae bacterium]|nr:nitrous oxide reductase accessory protein NosL [Chitinophagaceae bacterium]